MKSQHKGIMRVLRAFTYSYDGFKASFQSEAAFRQDLLVFILGVFSLMVLSLSLFEKAVLFFSLMLVLLMELVNTAIEAIVDRISDDYHKLSKKAKDIGSLLVLLSFVNAFVCWGLILYSSF